MKKKSKATAMCLCLAGMAFGQGNLLPPGAPAPTMKTLEEIGLAIDGIRLAAEKSEPRIDLATVSGDGTCHHLVNQPGSYYLSGNLEVTKDYGIKIDADGVSLDLNGYGISRVSGSGGAGVDVLQGKKRIIVQNGAISGFASGIFCLYAPPYVEGCLFRHLSISDCSYYGLYAGRLSQIVGCRICNNSKDGVFLAQESVMNGCVVSGNEGNGVFALSDTTIDGCTVENNVGTGSTSAGIFSGGDSLILDCTVRGNSHTNTAGTSAMGTGIHAGNGSLVRGCMVSNNKGDGIRMGANSLVVGNTCARNGYNGDGAGIHATGGGNRIDGNTVTDNDRGVDVDGTGNLIVRNIATYSGTPYDIVASNKVGTIVVAPNSGAVSGSTGGAGVGSTDPWANFSF